MAGLVLKKPTTWFGPEAVVGYRLDKARLDLIDSHIIGGGHASSSINLELPLGTTRVGGAGFQAGILHLDRLIVAEDALVA
jgi:hypothetical protein